MVQNLKKSSKSKNSCFLHPRGTKCRVETKNNCEAVVVCARHVMKRPSKRSALVLKYFNSNKDSLINELLTAGSGFDL